LTSSTSKTGEERGGKYFFVEKTLRSFEEKVGVTDLFFFFKRGFSNQINKKS